MSSHTTETIALPNMSPGTRRWLEIVRYGTPGARPKAYLQTALHADEIPGMLVMHHLRRRLEAAARAGTIKGEIVLVPMANPIGLAQQLLGTLAGRYELDTGSNFNRQYHDLSAPVAERLAGKLGADPAANVARVRAAIDAVLTEQQAVNELDTLRLTLLRLAVDSDICLDLHCDWEAVLHIYTGTPLWPAAADLAAQLGSHATLLATVSGGNPFDEAVGGLWWTLAERFADHPIPPACLAATVELRGDRDVDDTLAAKDADNLFRFLARRGLIDADPGALPAPLSDATPLAGVEPVTSPVAGVVSYYRAPGEQIAAGDAIALVVDPLASGDAARHEIKARTAGVLYARRGDRMARPGQTLARIAGTEPLPERIGKHLLGD